MSSRKDVETVRINEPFLVKTSTSGEDFWNETEKIKNEQKRINIYHFVVHILAFIIIIPYICLNIYKYEISATYSTIVSVIIGFYFARSLFN